MENELDFTTPIVNALQNEHNELFARTRSIDTRASILITILLAVLPFYFEILDWTYLKECFVSQCLSFRDFCMTFFFCGTIIGEQEILDTLTSDWIETDADIV